MIKKTRPHYRGGPVALPLGDRKRFFDLAALEADSLIAMGTDPRTAVFVAVDHGDITVLGNGVFPSRNQTLISVFPIYFPLTPICPDEGKGKETTLSLPNEVLQLVHGAYPTTIRRGVNPQLDEFLN